MEHQLIKPRYMSTILTHFHCGSQNVPTCTRLQAFESNRPYLHPRYFNCALWKQSLVHSEIDLFVDWCEQTVCTCTVYKLMANEAKANTTDFANVSLFNMVEKMHQETFWDRTELNCLILTSVKSCLLSMHDVLCEGAQCDTGMDWIKLWQFLRSSTFMFKFCN